MSPGFFFLKGGYQEGVTYVSELSIFVDESGDVGRHSDYYFVALVFHEQDDPISPMVEAYEHSLIESGLDLIPFHMDPLLNGHGDYQWKTIANRKRQLTRFSKMVSHLPISYELFGYSKKKSSFEAAALSRRLREDMEAFFDSHPSYFQKFDVVKVYYDDGQSLVTRAVHTSVEHAIARSAAEYRDASPRAYRLSQVADYICGIELMALKYEAGQEGNTGRAFFGTAGYFRKNYLKQLRRKKGLR